MSSDRVMGENLEAVKEAFGGILDDLRFNSSLVGDKSVYLCTSYRRLDTRGVDFFDGKSKR